jgi:hypothetical protein
MSLTDPCGHQVAAALAGAGADVDDVVGAADGVFVVLHHHQRVALVAQLVQRVQQDAVVARMQADGRFVQHVAHALQVAAQLRRQADALRLAAAERGRGAVQRQVAQAHFFQEFEPAADLGDHVAGDAGFGVLMAPSICMFPPRRVSRHRQLCDVGDAHVEANLTAGLQVQPRAVAGRGRPRRPRPSTSGSDGKLCSRPLSSSSRTESSSALRCSRVSVTPVPTQWCTSRACCCS